MAKMLSSKELKYFIAFISLVGIFFVSFQYYWLANFPIGDDVLNHIQYARSLEEHGLFGFAKTSLYPLSVYFYDLEYRFLHALLGFGMEKAFIFTVSLNLFLTALLTAALAYRLFKDYKIAIVSAFLIATSRWLVDNLRMGVMAESFGWVFFLACMLLYFEKRWFPFAIIAIMLLFIHPMLFGMLLIYVVLFTAYLLVSGGKREKVFLLIAALIGGITIYALYKYDPWGVFSRAVSVAKLDMNVSSRSYLVYATDEEIRRYLVYILSFLGVILLHFEKERRYKLVMILYFVGMLIAFKDWFGIHYLSYRFYFYYELSAALLAAYGLGRMLQVAFKNYSLLFILPLAYLLVQPQWLMNRRLTLWQSTDYLAGATRPAGDRTMENEIVALIPQGALVYSQSNWAGWLTLRGVRVIHQDYKGLYQDYKYADLTTLRASHVQYLYFSAIEPRTDFEEKFDRDLIIDKDGVRLYELN